MRNIFPVIADLFFIFKQPEYIEYFVDMFINHPTLIDTKIQDDQMPKQKIDFIEKTKFDHLIESKSYVEFAKCRGIYPHVIDAAEAMLRSTTKLKDMDQFQDLFLLNLVTFYNKYNI